MSQSVKTSIAPIQVINLDRRKDRWSEFCLEATRVGISEYERYSAIDGLELKYNQEVAQVISTKNDFNWRRGVIGCALSHINVWKKIVQNNYSWTIVFEDDVTFKISNFPDYWNRNIKPYLDNLKETDIIYLGGNAREDGQCEDLYDQSLNKSPIYKVSDQKIHLGLYAYVLSLSGAKKLLNLVGKIPLTRAIDWWIIDNFMHIQAGIVKPLIATSLINYKTDIQFDYEPIAGLI